jgi:hypothetical protein
MHVLADGFVVRTLPSPVAPAARARLQGARLATGALPVPAGPAVVQRKVSRRQLQSPARSSASGWTTPARSSP